MSQVDGFPVEPTSTLEGLHAQCMKLRQEVNLQVDQFDVSLRELVQQNSSSSVFDSSFSHSRGEAPINVLGTSSANLLHPSFGKTSTSPQNYSFSQEKTSNNHTQHHLNASQRQSLLFERSVALRQQLTASMSEFENVVFKLKKKYNEDADMKNLTTSKEIWWNSQISQMYKDFLELRKLIGRQFNKAEDVHRSYEMRMAMLRSEHSEDEEGGGRGRNLVGKYPPHPVQDDALWDEGGGVWFSSKKSERNFRSSYQRKNKKGFNKEGGDSDLENPTDEFDADDDSSSPFPPYSNNNTHHVTDKAHLLSEQRKLHDSGNILTEITEHARRIVGSIADQNSRLRTTQTRLGKTSGTLQFSSGLLTTIRRRHSVDSWIVAIGMIFCLFLMFFLWFYWRK